MSSREWSMTKFHDLIYLGRNFCRLCNLTLQGHPSLHGWFARRGIFGSASHGKLKADQWRSVCTVSLIITLVRIWGSATASELQRKLLRNFTDLVIAVEIATKRSTSSHHVDIYRAHLTRYLRSLLELFPDHKLQTNHHLSMHLDECLADFGPVRSWWSFPFERYNGVMRNINTNNKPGMLTGNASLFCLS